MSSSKTPWEQASEWFGRTLAIVLMMVLPGAGGAWLDSHFGTSFCAALGFVFGMVVAIGLLMLFTRIKPIANDGQMLQSSMKTTAGGKVREDESSPRVRKPSETRLPKISAAEVLEDPQRDD